MSFHDLPLHADLLKAIDALKFSEPTPIQKQAIPAVLEGRDVLASAQTGTGKTLAFMLPVLHRMLTNPKPGITGLILLPTRELAAQVANVAKEVGRFTNIRTVLLVGGESFGEQLRKIRGGAGLVIATPGRLIDHLKRRTVSLSNVHTLILDEADRMMDMGFTPALHQILTYLPKERQTMLFSATLPNQITQLSHLALKDPFSIRLAPQGAPASSVTQMVYPVVQTQKNDLLLAMLRNTTLQSVLIFCRTKHGADRLARFLETEDFSVVAMHSDRSHHQRQSALNGFKLGRFQIMVATDVAARGIDVKKLSHVINYDVPMHTEDYVHRIGRTGRHLDIGDAWTILTPEEARYMAAIERYIGRKLPRVQIPDFPYKALPAEAKPKAFMERFGKKRRFIPRGGRRF